MLSELEAVLKAGDGDSKAAAIHKATNTFYALIPHSFGMRKAPHINSLEMVEQKVKLVESLLECELATRLIKVPSSFDPHHFARSHQHRYRSDVSHGSISRCRIRFFFSFSC